MLVDIHNAKIKERYVKQILTAYTIITTMVMQLYLYMYQ